MRLILATAAALMLSIATGSVTHAACCDVIPGVPPPPTPSAPIRDAPAAFFRFPGSNVLVPGELFPGPPPVFVTDSPLAPRPPQRFDVLTR